jgi:peptidoglycan/xylan/chitin deacetylase (PgdA/CDA1 family)
MNIVLSRRQFLAGATLALGVGTLEGCRSGTSSPGSTAATDPMATGGASPDATGGASPETTGGASPDTAMAATDSATPDTNTNTNTASASDSAGTSTSGSATAASGDGARYVNHGPTTGNQVALTFHLGGDPGLVAGLLDAMDRHGLPATFFAIGDWVTAHPDLTRRAVKAGHELGNHTKRHLSMLKLSRAQVREEIISGGQALVPFIGSIGQWFRPSGTDVPNDIILEEAGKAGYAVSLGYDLNSFDYKEPGAAAVVKAVNGAVHPGSIVSLHFGHQDTIDALPAILDHLQKTGLVPVTVGTLLG